MEADDHTTLCTQAVGICNHNSLSCYLSAVLQSMAHLDLKIIRDRLHYQTCPLVGGDTEHTCLGCATEVMLLQILFSEAGLESISVEWFATMVSDSPCRVFTARVTINIGPRRLRTSRGRVQTFGRDRFKGTSVWAH